MAEKFSEFSGYWIPLTPALSRIDAVRTAHRILRNHEFYRDFKKSDLSV
ncbi:MAG: hypothetical protein P8179_20460 [Candidatus Thiodiazotropha sp.]